MNKRRSFLQKSFAGLAGLAGSLFGVLNIVLPTMGAAYVVQAFLVVVVGGGTLAGSVVA